MISIPVGLLVLLVTMSICLIILGTMYIKLIDYTESLSLRQVSMIPIGRWFIHLGRRYIVIRHLNDGRTEVLNTADKSIEFFRSSTLAKEILVKVK